MASIPAAAATAAAAALSNPKRPTADAMPPPLSPRLSPKLSPGEDDGAAAAKRSRRGKTAAGKTELIGVPSEGPDVWGLVDNRLGVGPAEHPGPDPIAMYPIMYHITGPGYNGKWADFRA